MNVEPIDNFLFPNEMFTSLCNIDLPHNRDVDCTRINGVDQLRQARAVGQVLSLLILGQSFSNLGSTGTRSSPI